MSDKHAHCKRGEAQFITQISMATSLGSVHRPVCLLGAVSQTVKVHKVKVKVHKQRKAQQSEGAGESSADGGWKVSSLNMKAEAATPDV